MLGTILTLTNCTRKADTLLYNIVHVSNFNDVIYDSISFIFKFLFYIIIQMLQSKNTLIFFQDIIKIYL